MSREKESTLPQIDDPAEEEDFDPVEAELFARTRPTPLCWPPPAQVEARAIATPTTVKVDDLAAIDEPPVGDGHLSVPEPARCGNCGTLGLRTKEWVCTVCDTPFVDFRKRPVTSLKGMEKHLARGGLGCAVCDKIQLPKETLACSGCDSPTRLASTVATPILCTDRPDVPLKATSISGEPIIDDEFEALLPPHSTEEYPQMEQSLRADGCRHPLVVWRDGSQHRLLDGHRRFEICRTHGIPYEVEILDLPNREAACQWIIKNQLGRRNLSPLWYSYLLGRLYNSNPKRQGKRTDLTSGQNARKSTAETLGAEYGVDEKTVRLHAEFAKRIDTLAETHGPDVRTEILTKKIKIPQVHLPVLLQQDKATQEKIIAEVRQGQKISRLLPKPVPKPPKKKTAERTDELGTRSDTEPTVTRGAAAAEPPMSPTGANSHEMDVKDALYAFFEVIAFLDKEDLREWNDKDLDYLSLLHRQYNEVMNENSQFVRSASSGKKR